MVRGKGGGRAEARYSTWAKNDGLVKLSAAVYLGVSRNFYGQYHKFNVYLPLDQYEVNFYLCKGAREV